MKMNRVLILAEVAQLQDVVTILFQCCDGPFRAGFVIDIPRLAIDLPERMATGLLEIRRLRPCPLEPPRPRSTRPICPGIT